MSYTYNNKFDWSDPIDPSWAERDSSSSSNSCSPTNSDEEERVSGAAVSLISLGLSSSQDSSGLSPLKRRRIVRVESLQHVGTEEVRYPPAKLGESLRNVKISQLVRFLESSAEEEEQEQIPAFSSTSSSSSSSTSSSTPATSSSKELRARQREIRRLELASKFWIEGKTERAIESLLDGAKAGYLPSMMCLAKITIENPHCTPDERYRARKELTALCDQKNKGEIDIAFISHYLGYHYYLGDFGFERDLVKAQAFFEKAIEFGDPVAYVNLGTVLLEQENYLGAFEAYNKAEKYGEAPGFVYHSLGKMYANGHGVVQDLFKAAEYNKLAQENGYLAAGENLESPQPNAGESRLDDSDNDQKNSVAAFLVLLGQQGAEEGQGEALQDLSQMKPHTDVASDKMGQQEPQKPLESIQDQGQAPLSDIENKAKMYLERGRKGEGRAYFELGQMHEKGELHGVDLKAARSYYLLASKCPVISPLSLLRLADMAFKGTGGDKNPELGIKCLVKGQELGITKFNIFLAKIYLLGLYEQPRNQELGTVALEKLIDCEDEVVIEVARELTQHLPEGPRKRVLERSWALLRLKGLWTKMQEDPNNEGLFRSYYDSCIIEVNKGREQDVEDSLRNLYFDNGLTRRVVAERLLQFGGLLIDLAKKQRTSEKKAKYANLVKACLDTLPKDLTSEISHQLNTDLELHFPWIGHEEEAEDLGT